MRPRSAARGSRSRTRARGCGTPTRLSGGPFSPPFPAARRQLHGMCRLARVISNLDDVTVGGFPTMPYYVQEEELSSLILLLSSLQTFMRLGFFRPDLPHVSSISSEQVYSTVGGARRRSRHPCNAVADHFILRISTPWLLPASYAVGPHSPVCPPLVDFLPAAQRVQGWSLFSCVSFPSAVTIRFRHVRSLQGRCPTVCVGPAGGRRASAASRRRPNSDYCSLRLLVVLPACAMLRSPGTGGMLEARCHPDNQRSPGRAAWLLALIACSIVHVVTSQAIAALCFIAALSLSRFDPAARGWPCTPAQV